MHAPGRIRRLAVLCDLLGAGSPEGAYGDGVVDWVRLVREAGERLLGPALWSALTRHGLAAAPPAPLAESLKLAHRRNTARNLGLRSQLIEAVTVLNGEGIVPLLFKGSLYLIDGTFPDRGERSQWDLDLAVSPDEFARATAALGSFGYRPEVTKPFLHPHELSLIKGDNRPPLELHDSLGSPPIPQLLPHREVLAAARQVELGPARALGVSASHAVMHNVLHAQVQDRNHSVAGLPVRQLHTLTRLLQAHGDAVDWEAVRRRFADPRLSPVLSAYAHQAEVLFRAPLPGGLGDGLGPRLHHLRSLLFWQLGWPADVMRNLQFAFNEEYLAATYDAGGAGRSRSGLRIRHAYELVRSRGRGVFADTLAKRF